MLPQHYVGSPGKSCSGHLHRTGRAAGFSRFVSPCFRWAGRLYLFGDETTEDEGFNMQVKSPGMKQALFLQLAATMGRAYSLHTPLALPTALTTWRGRGGTSLSPRSFLSLIAYEYPGSLAEDFNLVELPTII